MNSHAKMGSQEALIKNDASNSDAQHEDEYMADDAGALTAEEKKFLLLVERGDVASIKRLIDTHKGCPEVLSVDCVDPLGRSAIIMAIENENYDLIQLLLNEGVKVKDSLLHAIKEEYVEAVELLLEWEEIHHQAGTAYSWEAADRDTAKFTPDITPLILAAHRNNYEIIKLLLDRGATIPVPHDVKCACDKCINSAASDSLRYSMSRINAYRALASPSLICLSSKDPFLTAFELSWELRRLAKAEAEFRADYLELRNQCSDFATTLLGHARTSVELQTLLNHKSKGEDDDEGWEPGERNGLERLKLAIKYKQKKFVAHPSVQQLLAAMWYDGLPGFRRRTLPSQIVEVAKLGASFPVNSFFYMLFPNSERGKFMKKPFVKFICHSCSYVFFLTLLAAASQRMEFVLLEWFSGYDWIEEILNDWKTRERGALPGLVESAIVIYIFGLTFTCDSQLSPQNIIQLNSSRWIWAEIKALWSDGIVAYTGDLWNVVDFITNSFYVSWICLRAASWYIVQREASMGLNPYYPREEWHMLDPMLISEGMFGAAMIFSFLKLVHMFSINPHLGPLQISLGRMIVDILKFFFIYSLVLFAFGCGLNQLLWYYADLEKKLCYNTPDGLENPEAEDSCFIWRRFANLFETSQSLFWASFGLVELEAFELQGIKGFTRFWGLLMFGSYSVINVIVLLNMLIAMMSTSYQIISERSDTEWKFARSKLWISYFDEGATVPAPFNMFPTLKSMTRCIGGKKGIERKPSVKRRGAYQRYLHITRLLVRRYVSAEETKKQDEAGITEDDVNEIRQDISSFRYELVDILKLNGMRTPNLQTGGGLVTGKKGKVMERRLMKDFQIGCVENAVKEAIMAEDGHKDVFSRIAKAIGRKRDKKDWNAMVRKASVRSDPIGSKQASLKRRSARRRRVEQENAALFSMDPDILAEYNPKLSEVTPATRVAYAKFKTKVLISHIQEEDSEPTSQQMSPVTPRAEHSSQSSVRSARQSVRKPPSSGSVYSRNVGSDYAVKSIPEYPGEGKSELEKSTERLDETPVLKPIIASMSLKRAADEKAKLEAKMKMSSFESQSGEGKTREKGSIGGGDKSSFEMTDKQVEDTKKSASTSAVTPATTTAGTSTTVESKVDTPPGAVSKAPESTVVTATATRTSPPPQSTSSSSEATVTQAEDKVKGESKSKSPSPKAGTTPSVDSSKAPAQKSSSPKKAEFTSVQIDEPTAGPSKSSKAPTPPRQSASVPIPTPPPRAPSPSGKSAVTGQTRTGWI